jgi:hypothetical protein
MGIRLWRHSDAVAVAMEGGAVEMDDGGWQWSKVLGSSWAK